MPTKLQTQQEQSAKQGQEPPDEVVEDAQEPEDGRTEPETFTAEYVAELRDEAAKNRIAAKRATDLESALRTAVIDKVAGSILQDTSVLEWTDEMADENGMPDPTAIRDAAEALAADKPHLSRVGGDVLQGHRGDVLAGEVDLAGMLRAGA